MTLVRGEGEEGQTSGILALRSVNIYEYLPPQYDLNIGKCLIIKHAFFLS